MTEAKTRSTQEERAALLGAVRQRLKVCDDYLRARFPLLDTGGSFTVPMSPHGEFVSWSDNSTFTTVVSYDSRRGLGIVSIDTSSHGMATRCFTPHDRCGLSAALAIAEQFPALCDGLEHLSQPLVERVARVLLDLDRFAREVVGAPGGSPR